jgi:PAS domain-containing protein
MSENDFNIYLVSNVSTEIFTDNSPAKFSTILAEDIHLPNGEWEVAVKNIVYPSHVQSTTLDDKIEFFTYEEEYRNLYPQIKREDYDENLSNGYKIKIPLAVAKEGGLNLAQTITTKINEDLKNRNLYNILKFEVKSVNGSSKIIFHIYPDDFVVFLNPALRHYFGFKDDEAFPRGSHWAWAAFNPAVRPPDTAERSIFMIDLRSQNQEKSILTRSFQLVEVEEEETKKDEKKTTGTNEKTDKKISSKIEKVKKRYINEVFYESRVNRRFKDNKDDDLLSEPKLTITIRPEQGTITLHKSDQDIPFNLRIFEKNIRMIKFDDTTTQKLKLKLIYYMERGQLPDEVITFKFKKVKSEDIKELTNCTCTIYFEGLRELSSEINVTPIDVINIDVKETFIKPNDFLQHLNTSTATKHGIKFIFDEKEQRFYLQNGRKTHVRLSKSLASILGFSNLINKEAYPSTFIRANDFPVLDRAISSLYVYSNIVQSVFIGNVKASLLLTCPFLKTTNNNVAYLEFLNPTFTKLNRSTIHQVDIAIHDEAGALIPFLNGKTVLTLIFRKCNV